MLSFYDWYADLPVASPQVFGDQTDVPESGDWWDAGYLIMWGSNVPVTRTPDAHWMTEARYRGQKVVVVAPDYADNVKFADEWLAGRGRAPTARWRWRWATSSCKEFFVDRQATYFADYVKQYTDLPYLVRARRGLDGLDHRRSTRRASSSPPPTCRPTSSRGERRLQDRADRRRAPDSRSCPTARSATGSARPGRAGGTSTSATSTPLSLIDDAGEQRAWCGCRASTPPTAPAADRAPRRAGAPGRRPPGHDGLRPAARAVRRRSPGAAGRVARDDNGYDDASAPYTPAWQEAITGVPAAAAARIGREFAQNAEDSHGRSMIVMGAGHQPLVPLRHDLPLRS